MSLQGRLEVGRLARCRQPRASRRRSEVFEPRAPTLIFGANCQSVTVSKRSDQSESPKLNGNLDWETTVSRSPSKKKAEIPGFNEPRCFHRRFGTELRPAPAARHAHRWQKNSCCTSPPTRPSASLLTLPRARSHVALTACTSHPGPAQPGCAPTSAPGTARCSGPYRRSTGNRAGTRR